MFGGCASGSKIEIDTRRLHYDEIKVLSVFHHTPLYFREALRLIASGKVDVEQLITLRMSLNETEKALLAHQNGEANKVLINP